MKHIFVSTLFLFSCSEAKSPEEELTQDTTEQDTDTEETEDDSQEEIEQGKVVINEISIDPTDTEDWIEFYNPTTEDADIGAWLIGDDIEELYSISQLSADTIVPAGGFLAIYTKMIDENEEEVGFGIKKDGTETLFLLEAGLDGDVEEIIIPAMETENLTYGRIPDGSDSWENELAPSFESSNTPE